MQSEDAQSGTLLTAEVGQRRVAYVISLQVQLVEGWQELRDGCHCLIGDIDTVRDREGDNPRAETCPETSVCDVIAAGEFQLVQTLELVKGLL